MSLRIMGALVALISALIHLWEYFFEDYDSTGVGIPFLINVVAGIVIAILLLTWRNWVPLFLLFGFGVLSLAGFIISATVGLFGVDETWNNAMGWAAMIVEAIAIVVAVVAAMTERRGMLRA
ncbi:MAG: hypothetical protein ABI382_01620 [Nakamurella sp.]